jgi:glycosyltransferase involved in cell wall biosynthesis
MSNIVCRECLPDDAYRDRMLSVTRERREALEGARIIVLSRYMASELEAIGLTNVEVVPPWFEPGRMRRAPGISFLLGGRLVAHKAPVDAVRAWRRAGCKLPLRVAGSGPLETELEGALLLGWLSREELVQELRRARALIFPSFWQEPFGMLGVESLAQGTPVIVTDSGGTLDWSETGCIRVPTGDVAGLVSGIQRLTDDPGFATQLGQEGRQMVVDRFSRTVIEPRLRALYADIAGG